MAVLSCFLGAIWKVQKKLVQSNFQVTPPQLLTKSRVCCTLYKKTDVISHICLAPLVGLEPTTYRLTAERSTN